MKENNETSSFSLFTKSEIAELEKKETELVFKAKQGQVRELIEFWNMKREMFLARAIA